MSPPLSTVQVPKVMMGQTAAYWITSLAEERSATTLKIEVNTRLIKRKSV